MDADSADVSFELVYVCLRLYDNRNSWHSTVRSDASKFMVFKFDLMLNSFIKNTEIEFSVAESQIAEGI